MECSTLARESVRLEHLPMDMVSLGSDGAEYVVNTSTLFVRTHT